MTNKTLTALGVVLALAGVGVITLNARAGTEMPAYMVDDAEAIALGEQVYAENCASCHGTKLEGAPNWRQRGADGLLPAPPHDATGHTWHHDSETLFKITKYGIAKLIGDPDHRSGMPAYEGVLSDAEIIAVLSFIRESWPDDIKAAYDAREAGE
ncbi:cytochrome c [Rhodobacteraceae bacterium 63075]|nr:cytochrome c [Rhodobacteraceae bacterium 63075]